MHYKVNKTEHEALYGLTHLQQLVYLRGIRPFMDYASGIVGIKRGISYQSLKEELYVEPHPGYQSGSPSKDQIRRALKALQKAELIEIQSQRKKLILKCILASQDSFIQNKATIKSPHQGASFKNSNSSNFSNDDMQTQQQAATSETAKAATHPVSGNNYKNTNSMPLKIEIQIDYMPSPQIIEKAQMLKCYHVNREDELSKFIAHHMSRGTKSYDWDAEYLCWLLIGKKYHEKENNHGQVAPENYRRNRQHASRSAVDRVMQANSEIIEFPIGRIINQENDNTK